MDPHGTHETPMPPSATTALPEPVDGWRSRWARRRAEKAYSIQLLTDARQRRAAQTAAERAAGQVQDPMSWPLRLLAALVALVVLAVAAVIAAVTVGAGVGFYDTHLGVKNISFAALGIQTPLNLPTFTPLATEGIVWATTLLAIVMVLLNRTATLWTRSMWAFASVAAFVGSWFGINDEHDLFGGVLRGLLSLAGPYLVHLFILWCRHLRSGKTLVEARIDMEIRWRAIGQRFGAVLVLVLRHFRHPKIAGRAFGYWLGVDHWGYRSAWRAASIDYRRTIQKTLDSATRPPAPAASDTTAEADRPAAAPVVDDAAGDGGVLTAERPAFDEAEIAAFVAELDNLPAAFNMAADQREQVDGGNGRDAAGTGGRPRPERTDTADGAPSGGGRTATGRGRRPRLARRPTKRVAGTQAAAGVDIADLLPAALEVAAELGGQLTRDKLVDGLRARKVSVGGRRKKAIYDAVRAQLEGTD